MRRQPLLSVTQGQNRGEHLLPLIAVPTFACSAICLFLLIGTISGCGQNPTVGEELCGNGRLDPGEPCDGNLFGAEGCEAHGFYAGGKLSCTSSCGLDLAGCTGGRCGDGTLNGSEECDGEDIGDESCETLGHGGGELSCSANCRFDTSGCTSAWNCGDTLVDTRDSKGYETVLLGEQCWMATNLDVGERIDSSQPQATDSLQKYCYNDDPALCASDGGLYQWPQVMQGASTEGARGICPEGWHVPSDGEWKALEVHLGMTAADADLGNTWRGTSVGTALKLGGSSGLDGLLAGLWRAGDGSIWRGSMGYYWTSSSGGPGSSGSGPWRRCLSATADDVGRWDTFPGTYGFSMRCVHDAP